VQPISYLHRFPQQERAVPSVLLSFKMMVEMWQKIIDSVEPRMLGPASQLRMLLHSKVQWQNLRLIKSVSLWQHLELESFWRNQKLAVVSLGIPWKNMYAQLLSNHLYVLVFLSFVQQLMV